MRGEIQRTDDADDNPFNFSTCASDFVNCNFIYCTSSCMNVTSTLCLTCLNSADVECTSKFLNCARLRQNKIDYQNRNTLLIGQIDLNQNATEVNTQIAGASIGVLCSFVVLLICLSMTDTFE
jgi:hypothetical protein